MIDLVRLKVLAGDGGHGWVSLHREKYQPKGGPDGGQGGCGGSVLLQADKNLNTLKHFVGAKEFQAQAGQMGGKNKKTGKAGQDLVLKVPLGTVVWLTAENKVSQFRREKYARPVWEELVKEDEQVQQPRFRLEVTLDKQEVKFEKYYLEEEGAAPAPLPSDDLAPLDWTMVQPVDEVKQFTQADQIKDAQLKKQQAFKALKLVELRADQQQVVLCQGGFGGRGNTAFKSSTHQTPLEAEYGSFGEQKAVLLELKLLADVGLVGLPNAGKSTLLSRLTKAKPKIGNYPFTTLEPNLGMLKLKARAGEQAQDLVLADIPGLIAGASQGKGLGDRFLRHIDNCQVLMFMLYLDENQVFADDLTVADKAALVWDQYQTLHQELEQSQHDFSQKQRLVTLNKIDIYDKKLIEAVVSLFKQKSIDLLCFSAATGEGLESVRERLVKIFEKK